MYAPPHTLNLYDTCYCMNRQQSPSDYVFTSRYPMRKTTPKFRRVIRTQSLSRRPPSAEIRRVRRTRSEGLLGCRCPVRPSSLRARPPNATGILDSLIDGCICAGRSHSSSPQEREKRPQHGSSCIVCSVRQLSHSNADVCRKHVSQPIGLNFELVF